MSETLEVFGRTYPAVAGFKAKSSNGNVYTYTRGGGGISITQDASGALVLDDEGAPITDYLQLRATNSATEYINEEITSLTTSYFIDKWSNLTKISLPNCTSFTQSFAMGANGNANLVAHFPKLQSLAGQGLQNFKCTCLVLPAITNIPNYCLYGTNIPIVDLGANCTSIDGQYSLSGTIPVIILRSSSVCSLSNTNCLQTATWGSSGTGGTLYVPLSLINSYKGATNWSTILGYTNNSVVAIEGSQYEYFYADGTGVTS